MTQSLSSFPFFRYLSEIRVRSLILLFSFLCTLSLSYVYWFELLSLGVFPVLRTAPTVSFLFTEPQSGFFAVLKMSTLATCCTIFPFFWYHLWSFLVPSYYCWERQRLTRLFVLSLSFWSLSFVLLFVLLFPTLFSFFVQYQFESEKLTLRIEPRIDAYVDLLTFLCVSLFCVSQLPLVFLFFLSRGLCLPDQLATHRGKLQPVFFLLAAFCAPPDLFVQLGLTAFFSWLFEFCLWFGCLSHRVARHRVRG